MEELTQLEVEAWRLVEYIQEQGQEVQKLQAHINEKNVKLAELKAKIDKIRADNTVTK